jgi:hypothetical protein
MRCQANYKDFALGTVSMKKRIRLNNNGSLRILPGPSLAPRRKFKQAYRQLHQGGSSFGAGFAKALNSSRVFPDSEAQRLRNHAVAVK